MHLAGRTAHAPSVAELLGIEGEAAARYFRLFTTMLGEAAREFPEFQFEKRTRRPPADPVNALLSFGYALLTRPGLRRCRRWVSIPTPVSIISRALAARRSRST